MEELHPEEVAEQRKRLKEMKKEMILKYGDF